MKIENFDTGLKGQEDVENIIITPEENYKNKQKVKKNENSFFLCPSGYVVNAMHLVQI